MENEKQKRCDLVIDFGQGQTIFSMTTCKSCDKKFSMIMTREAECYEQEVLPNFCPICGMSIKT